MIYNYVKITLRTMIRHKIYSLINVLGLAFGVAGCVLILLYVQDELSYDTFHAKADRIYRVTTGLESDRRPTNANGSYAEGPALVKEFPEIEKAVRFRKLGWGEKRVVAYGDRRFYEGGFMFADSSVFDIFSFKLLEGNAGTALVAPGTVVITESMARKYLGNEDPMGKVLTVDAYNDGKFTNYTVTGVMQDVPVNSHIQFDFLASWSSQTDVPAGWGVEGVFTYVLLNAHADPKALEGKFFAFLDRQIKNHSKRTIHLQPLRDIRLHSHLNGELEPNGDIMIVYIFSSIALFILLIACINFINLATARSLKRAKEVGMRKVLGAFKGQLFRQFMGEALITSAVATLVAMGLAAAMLPVFNHISEKSMEINLPNNPFLVVGLLVEIILVGFLAGSYPSLLLSSFQPIESLRGKFGMNVGWSSSIRKGLVVFQFFISVSLIVCTIVAAQQMKYVRTKDLGFQRDQILVLPLNNEVRNKCAIIKNELLSDPHVLSASLSEQVPGRAGDATDFILAGNPEEFESYRLFADYDFIKTYGISLAAGRDFSRAFGNDSAAAFIVNESFVRSHNFHSAQDAVGARIAMARANGMKTGTIVGVAKDFNIFSLHERVDEAVICIMPFDQLNFVSIKLSPADIEQTLHHVENVWKKEAPNYPFDYYFIDADFEKLHRADQKLGEVFESFAVLAILAACLGLFGLSSFTTEQRKKEVGIRKTLGASALRITGLLTGEFVRVIVIANAIAWPVSYFAMNKWLQSFAYKTDLSVWAFVLAGGITFAIAGLTVGYQALKAAFANPLDALKYE